MSYDKIYHFTDAQGLVSILATNSLVGKSAVYFTYDKNHLYTKYHFRERVCCGLSLDYIKLYNDYPLLRESIDNDLKSELPNLEEHEMSIATSCIPNIVKYISEILVTSKFELFFNDRKDLRLLLYKVSKGIVLTAAELQKEMEYLPEEKFQFTLNDFYNWITSQGFILSNNAYDYLQQTQEFI